MVTFCRTSLGFWRIRSSGLELTLYPSEWIYTDWDKMVNTRIPLKKTIQQVFTVAAHYSGLPYDPDDCPDLSQTVDDDY